MDIKITKTTQPKDIPSEITSFGKIFTDHIFLMDWDEGQGWHDARIVPNDSLAYSPAASVFHYGQGIFEGLKAYKNTDGTVRLFRPQENFKRLNRSAQRLDMPTIDEAFALEALKTLVLLEADWIPTAKDTSLYIRPFMISNEETLGVHSSKKYQFIILLSPSGPYYQNGLDPVDIMVEKEYVRAVRGGLGEAKTMANYAASILAGTEAAKKGYSQVLWLDGVERAYIEEVGSMNIMFKVNGTVYTPALNGSILPGITRKSIIEILKDWNIPTEEVRLPLQDIIDAGNNGTLEEVFGTGTAAVISPVKHLNFDGTDIVATSNYGDDSLSHKLYDELTGIQTGRIEDTRDWVLVLN